MRARSCKYKNLYRNKVIPILGNKNQAAKHLINYKMSLKIIKKGRNSLMHIYYKKRMPLNL